MNFRIRTAEAGDVPTMHRIRLSVRENRLCDPMRVTEQSYPPFVDAASAWVAETDDGIVGFAIVDEPAGSVWALFVDPRAEGAGVGRALHEHMLQWASERGITRLSLETSAATRAERFYTKAGWRAAGTGSGGQLRLEKSLPA
jgi:GNAT superfamily N-acetyltransferase